MITFTPLSGSAHNDRTTPLCYVLQIDDVRILLDCGSPDWCPETMEGKPPWEEYCTALREVAPSIDLVLLSHGDLAHSGLFAYAFSRWGLGAPTYTTLPVQAMARIATLEDIEDLREEQDFGGSPNTSTEEEKQEDGEGDAPVEKQEPVDEIRCVATYQEVQDAFDSVNTLRYSQPTHLQGKCQGLTITPFSAGHTLGGTIWKIRSPSSGTFVYAVDLNHMRERHLDGTVLMRPGGGVFESLARPDVLITDAERTNVTLSRRKDRDAALIDTVTTTLSSRSSLLLPCDSSTRVLELLVLLDQHWNFSRLKYPICLLSRTGEEMLTFVRSMMEWMGGTISKEDVGEDNPDNKRDKRRRDDDDEAIGALALRFRHLKFFINPQSLIQSYSTKEPKLILAVPSSLSHGPSRHLFTEFATIPDNVVLLTGRGEEGTLSRQLFDIWDDAQRAETKWDKGKIGSSVMLDRVLKLEMHSKVPLQGEELEEYQQRERAAQEKAAAKKANEAINERMLEADEGDSEDDSDDDAESDDDDDEAEVREALDPSKKRPSKRRKTDADSENIDWMDGDEGLTKQQVSFDIYLKGNVSKSTSFFKSASGGQTQRFRMFPYIEKKRRVDEYGETVDVGMWLRKGKVLEEDAESEEVKELKRAAKAEEDAKNAQLEPPSKFSSSEIEVQLACRLLFIDLEGLNDGRAVKTIIPQVNPRKMILVRANTSAIDALVDSCSNIRSMTKDIFAPKTGESIQIGQQINSFSISISDDVLNALKMSSFEDNELAHVTGRVVIHTNSTVPVLEPSEIFKPSTSQTSESMPRVLGSRPAAIIPRSTLIGELKLTALKSRLAEQGVQAELIGEGVLVCAPAKKGSSANFLEESVAVRKTARGKIELEGSVSDTYYTVRREIYKLHALVAA